MKVYEWAEELKREREREREREGVWLRAKNMGEKMGDFDFVVSHETR